MKTLQRKCACGGSCGPCRKNREPIQRAGTGHALESQAPPIVRDVLHTPGEPLDARTRAAFESRFGHDFSGVRVHRDAHAARSAEAIHARAYTFGDHIVFGSGSYEPASPRGAFLLAHELTHVVQQQRSPAPAPPDRYAISPSHDPRELEADAAARAVAEGSHPVIGNAPRRIHRTFADNCAWGEIRSWAIVSQSDLSAPAGLGNAKTSVGAACGRGQPCACSQSGAGATAPGDRAAWANIVAANGADNTGGGAFMCVGSQGCWFVHRCYGCSNGQRALTNRATNLATSGTTTVAGKGTLYFYNDPLQGWCTQAERNSGCRQQPPRQRGGRAADAAPEEGEQREAGGPP